MDCFARAEREVDDAIRAKVAELLAKKEDPVAGGVAGDTAKDASDLVLAARTAAAGDAASVRQAITLLESALVHQQAFIERVDAAVKEPRKRASYEIWNAAGLKGTDTGRHEALLDRAEAQRRSIEQQLADLRRPGRTNWALTARRSFGRDAIAKTHANGLLHQALASDTLDHARGLIESWEAAMAPDDGPEPEEGPDLASLFGLGRIARATAAVGEQEGTDWLSISRNDVDVMLENLQSNRRSGDAYEKALHQMHRSRLPEELPISRASSAEAVMARARAMTRIPRRFDSSRDRYRPNPYERIVLTIPADPAAIIELAAEGASNMYAQRPVRFNVSETRRGGRRGGFLAVSRIAKINGQSVEVRAMCSLGSSRMTTDESNHQWALERSQELGLSEVMAAAMTVKDPSDFDPCVLGKPVLSEGTSMSSRIARASAQRLPDLVGADRCAHPNASWTSVRRPGKQRDSARLRCPDCLRNAIASVPLHRLPEGHPSLEDLDERTYLARERYYAELAGRTPSRATTVAQLRSEDGEADLNPAAYAVGEDLPGANRPKSVRSLLARSSR